MIDISFALLLMLLIFQVGVMIGERNILKRIKKYILDSKNWDEFLEKISKDWNDWEV